MTSDAVSVLSRGASLPRVFDDGKPSELQLWWLGQAGFLLRTAEVTVVIDPYLSDSLAEKYRAREFAHTRMMDPPVQPDQLGDADVVVSTHGHTDHLDPGTLGPIAGVNPDCRFIVARSTRGLAIERGIPSGRLDTIDAGESWSDTRSATGKLTIHAFPAAHEELETDRNGYHRYLGYVLDFGISRVYHSGDCVPYDGLVETVRALGPDIALLPINGRDGYRADRGVPGNFTVPEAVDLAKAIGARYLVGHHFGMFDFNTVKPEEAQGLFERIESPQCLLPEVGVCYRFPSVPEAS